MSMDRLAGLAIDEIERLETENAQQRELIGALVAACEEARAAILAEQIERCPYCQGTFTFRRREFEDDVFIGLGAEEDCPRCRGWRNLWTRMGDAARAALERAGEVRGVSADRSEIIRLLAISAYSAYLNTLVGNPAPRIAALYQEIKNPKEGDLVLETSTIGRRPTATIGRLLRVVKEPAMSAEEWDVPVNGPVPNDTFWYIENLDGQEERWSNCSFIKVLETPPGI